MKVFICPSAAHHRADQSRKGLYSWYLARERPWEPEELATAKRPGCQSFPESGGPLASEAAAVMHNSPPSRGTHFRISCQEVIKCKEEVGASHNCRNLAPREVTCLLVCLPLGKWAINRSLKGW